MCRFLGRARATTALLFLTLSVFAPACVSYSSGLGYRARQAVLERDVEAFRPLMEEASETPPLRWNDDPKTTVLTHFLDLASDPRFLPYIDGWKQKGWVQDAMTCAIYRARYQAIIERDPVEAERAAEICLSRARAASGDVERRWELDACLSNAPFLTLTSTSTLLPYLDIVADSTEPPNLRARLLEGMTYLELIGPKRRLINELAQSKDQARIDTKTQLDAIIARFEWIIDAIRGRVDSTLIARGSAMGAMEIERVSIELEHSFVVRWAEHDDPAANDLAWGWVRALKSRKRFPRLAVLGIWNSKKEPRLDAFWYACGQRVETVHEVTTLRAPERVADRDKLGETECPAADPSAKVSIVGPYPLEATAKAAFANAVRAHTPGTGAVKIVVKRRKLL